MNFRHLLHFITIILLLTYISVAHKRGQQVEHLKNELIILKEECIGVPGVSHDR